MAATGHDGGDATTEDDDAPDPSQATVQRGAGSRSDPSTSSLPGRYAARVWDLECVLELHLDCAGRLQGSFSADGEPLLVVIGLTHANGQVSGQIRARNLAEIFAGFRARLGGDGNDLNVDVTDPDGELESSQLETAAQVLFKRLP